MKKTKSKRRPTFFILLLLCLLPLSCSESPKDLYQRLDQQAEQFIEKGKFQQALISWENLIKLQPDSSAIYLKIGKISLLTGQYHKALRAFHQFLKLKPENLETWLEISRINLILGDIYSARESLDKSGESKNTEQGMILQGDLLAAQKKFSKAKDIYQEVIKNNPQSQIGLARLALIFLGLNKPGEAREIFTRLTALKPNSANIILQMGNYWLLAGNSKKAAAFFSQAVEQNPNNQNLKIRLAMFYINHQQYKSAIAILSPLNTAHPDNRFVKKILIESLLLDNSLTNAAEILNNLTKSEENDLDFHMLRGQYYLNNLEINTAVSQFLIVVEKEPKLPIGHYLLSLGYLAGGQSMLAQKSLIKCLTLNSDFSDAELALADFFYKNKNYTFAWEHVERICKQEPENFRPHLIKGNILLAQKKYKAALREYQNALILNPELIAPALYSATALFLAGNIEKADSIYQAILETKPELIDALLQYINFLANNNRSDEAADFLEKLISKQTSTASSYQYCILAMLNQQMNQPETAADNLQKALTANPAMRTAYAHLFDLYNNDLQKTEKFLYNAINNIKCFNKAYIRLAYLYCKNNQPQKAIALLEEALTADPESAQLANNLAWLYVEFQPEDLNEAMRLAQKAYEKLPDNPATADTLGWIYCKKNMPTRAKWLLKQAHELEPENTQINAHLAAMK